MPWWSVLLLVLVVVAAGVVLLRLLAARALARLLASAREAVVRAVGGTTVVDVVGAPLDVLLRLRRREVPEATVRVDDAVLPNGLPVRLAVLRTSAGTADGELVAHVAVAALEASLRARGAWAAALRVRPDGDRLRVRAGLASLAVELGARDGSLVVRVPAAAGPLGDRLEAALTELLPRPPDGVHVDAVGVRDDEVVVTATVDLDDLVARATG